MRILHHEDCLEFMNRTVDDGVDLIITDPPFNTGKDFGEYDDRWNWDKNRKILDLLPEGLKIVICGAMKNHSESLAAYLCYMGIRLIHMKRKLKPTGSIYLHCDSSASHYLKMLMDGIFGADNFQNDIAWCYTGANSVKTRYPRKHDNILFYTNGGKAVFNAYAIRIPYAQGSKNRDKYGNDYDGAWGGGGKGWLNEKGKIPEDYWTDIQKLQNHNEKVDYPTQKPLALYERMILASSNPGDSVFDPFMGSGTVLVIAKQLGRIHEGCDINENAVKITGERLAKADSIFNHLSAL